MRTSGMMAAAWLISGCATAPVETSGTGLLEPEKGPDGATIRRFDLDGDGSPELWRVSITEPDPADPTKTIERVTRVDLDMNLDGKVDNRSFLDAAGDVERTEIDLDYDSRVDAIATFQGGVRIREDMYIAHGPNPEVVRLYSDGKLVEKRRDIEADGKFDIFEYFDGGRLVRVGRDTNGDGEADKYDERPDADSALSEDKPAAPEPEKPDEEE